MSESHLAQLRFDILEKVQIQPQQTGIRSLLELDLFPDVRIEDQETHLRIHGFLRLNGTYEGDDALPTPEKMDQGEEAQEEVSGKEIEKIAYVIPVEITLPMDRADQERITAEVEAFDYKVLSPFELHIEAVLVIDGLLPESEEEVEEGDLEEEAVREQAEDIMPTFASFPSMKQEEEPERFQDNEEPPQEKDPQRDKDSAELDYQFFHIASDMEEERQQDEMDSPDLQEDVEEEEHEEPDSPLREPDTHEFQPVQESNASFQDEASDASSEPLEEPEDDSEALAPTKEIPFALNPRQHSDKYVEDFSLGKLLRPLPDLEPTSGAQKEQETLDEPSRREEKSVEEQLPTEMRGEEKTSSKEDENVEHSQNTQEETSNLEWTRWLVSEEKEDPFVRMKMVIVQRDESLAGIADRYDVSPSELRSMNALESEVLEEGQIVYIPQKSE